MKNKNEGRTHFQAISIRMKKEDRRGYYKIGRFRDRGRMFCRLHPKIVIREFKHLIGWEVSSDYFDFILVFEKESEETLYFDHSSSENIQAQSDIIKGLMKEGAYHIAMDFIDYIMQKKMMKRESW